MSVLRPRNRLVYFRVSEDEFQRFNNICEAIGARSISDLARSAMQNMIQGANDGHPDPVAAKLTVLEAMVNDLSQKIQLLTTSLGTMNERPNGHSANPERFESSNGDSWGGK
jgi:hypothetical protein